MATNHRVGSSNLSTEAMYIKGVGQMKKLLNVKYWTTPDNLMGLKECDWDEWHEDALVRELVKNKYVICGDTHQHQMIPVFNDGYLILSMRKWAEVMDLAYVHINPTAWPEPWFYMASTCNVREKLPNAKIDILGY